MPGRSAFPANASDADKVRYYQGYEVQKLELARGSEYANQDKYGPFYVMGQEDARGGFLPWFVRGPNGQPVPGPSGTGSAGSGYAPLPSQNGTRDDFQAYVAGYESGTNLPDQTDRGPWFVAGQIDRRRNNLAQFIQLAGNVWGPNPQAAGQTPMVPSGAQPRSGSMYRQGPVLRTPDGRIIVAPPMPSGGTPAPVTSGGGQPQKAPPYVPRQQPPLTGWLGQFPYYEVSASILGKPVPLDLVLQLQNAQGPDWLITGVALGTSVQVLGFDPEDSRRGFRLSGPSGPIARRVQAAIARGQLLPDPRRYGLDGWYGAKTRTGVRLLTARDLQALNFAPAVFDERGWS